MVDRSLLTSAGVTEGSIERGVPLKGASVGGGWMMGDPSLALMDYLRLKILIEKKKNVELNSATPWSCPSSLHTCSTSAQTESLH